MHCLKVILTLYFKQGALYKALSTAEQFDAHQDPILRPPSESLTEKNSIVPDRYAVVGHPVGHSLSPRIHALFADQTGESIDYGSIEPPLDGLEPALKRFFASGARGCNITAPFKEEAWRLCAERSPQAERAGAVNTLLRAVSADGPLQGDNTDGIGFMRDLKRLIGRPPTGFRVLILGAGGSARGLLAPLIESRPARILIANRTLDRARGLAKMDPFPAETCDLAPDNKAFADTFDLVINCTGRGSRPPPSVIGRETVFYDLDYRPSPTPLMEWARALGARLVADGLGMLVEQAAESFYLWRGKRPDTHPVRERLQSSTESGGIR